MDPRTRRRFVQGAVAALGVAPLAALGVGLATDRLGADPIETLTHETGEWALRFLLLTLAVTPARRLLDRPGLAPFRRTLGLLAFTYATVHLATYVVLDHFFDWELLVEDVFERPFVTAGFFAWCCLVPLAVTSTRRAIRRLGRRWAKLHRLAYVAAIAAVVHFYWGVKADVREPLVFAGILAALLLARVVWRLRSAQRASVSA